MGVLSLQSLISTMNERNCAGAESAHDQLTDLLNKINIMYQYRNDQRRDSGVVRNACYQHWYGSYGDYLHAKGLSQNPLTLSIGNLDQATSNIAYCSCNARQIGGCSCVSVINQGARCSCNVRNPYTCECHSRTGGKYDPVCYCDTRNAAEGGSLCNCVSRSGSLYCDCNARCTCNSVSEFTMTPEAAIRASNGCTCESRQYADRCENHYSYSAAPCQCQNRAINCNGVSNAPNGWDGYCGWHKRPTTRGICQCNERSSSYNYCSCVSRGTTSCQCNVRGGVMPI